DSRNAFTQAGRTSDENAVFAQLRELLHLRQQHPALRRGKYVHIFSDDRTLVYVRDFQQGRAAERLLMVMNNADQARKIEVSSRDTLLVKTTRLTRLWANQDASLAPGAKITVELPARSLSIYNVE